MDRDRMEGIEIEIKKSIKIEMKGYRQREKDREKIQRGSG